MPRANRHIQPGHTYHVTHRCHNRASLLRFARDRQAYRAWLRDGLGWWPVQLLTYCLTSNHVHLLVRSPDAVALAGFMQLVAGVWPKCTTCVGRGQTTTLLERQTENG